VTWQSRTALLGVTLALSACLDTSDSATSSGALTPLEEGAALYEEFCGACHGEQAEGSEICVSLINPHINEQSDGKLFVMIQSGTGGTMPSFGDVMSNDEIMNVIAYLRSIQTDMPHGGASPGDEPGL
jgi:mono/diheme cytochrome c family protein